MNTYHNKTLENTTQIAASHKHDQNTAIQLKDNRPNSVAQLKQIDSNEKVVQLCQHNHPQHASIAVCPYGLKSAAFRIPPKHVKGAKASKFSEGSQAVMDHAHAQLTAGNATVESTIAGGGHDIEVSVPRAHRHLPARPPRRFNVHKTSNNDGSGQLAHDFFLKNGESSESEASDAEEEDAAPAAAAAEEEHKEEKKS
ncbi:hypothetical protein KHA90_11415 [Flavobacterium psychroterrae]|uniref:DUF4157 domain-containing protein n=1 Tax=Flavobacterium psychroterrae TaxID=2133767 RepID=A0ABS5PBG4_9FLAO|nr:hypothetical protein [Flavobacterium psychroterrae]MBS7231633.1 hypothetical protein [Flavobacterium psychroterrae]